MIKSNFREWTLDMIDDAFGMMQVDELDSLNSLLSFEHIPDDFEKKYLIKLQNIYKLGGDDWNEVELENKFISPLIVFSDINNKQFSYFLERPLEAKIGEYELSGKVDGMIATGFRSPKKPYFCMKEYKKGTDPDGDPKGQALIAMIVTQAINSNKNPIYGCFIVGSNWYFMSLEDKKYAISNVFTCTDEEIFDIFRVLKGLKVHIERLID